MEGLAEAAARAAEEADTDAAQQPAQAAPDNTVSGKKRGRGTKVEAAEEKKLQDLTSRRAIAAAKVEQLKGLESRKKRDEEALKSATNKVAGFDATIRAARHGADRRFRAYRRDPPGRSCATPSKHRSSWSSICG